MPYFDAGEMALFAEYWGDTDLAHNEGFWEDVYKYYSQEPHDAPLPLRYSPSTVRRVQDMLVCPPGECGGCCNTYKMVPLWPYDIRRIIEQTKYSKKYLARITHTRENGTMFMNSHPDGCVFLKDNVCTIYEARPDACWLFPIGSRDSLVDGKAGQQMTIRIRCPAALAIARELITESLSTGKMMLLPDLTVIPKGETKCG